MIKHVVNFRSDGRQTSEVPFLQPQTNYFTLVKKLVTPLDVLNSGA